ncbi:hypothetical protein [Pseudomarimonas salicorniae]|uniref:Uncharacterized protein n=1 Tax=Pseudomarimonas salicorniae TaxID=2933270 RepID=A0ABT0GDQ0_9GAMM|nr:hypothetical protein [Lysobacter sp. CAU 1642]MCK7592472.1 hypothetical protein [Lysobacter sp. CAU 1642]
MVLLAYCAWLVAVTVAVLASVPFGAIGASIAWAAAVGAVAVVLVLGGRLGRWLSRQIWHPRMGDAARTPRTNRAIVVMLVAGLVCTLALHGLSGDRRQPRAMPSPAQSHQALDAKERAADQPAPAASPCYFWGESRDTAKTVGFVVGNLGAHGRSIPRRAPCRLASLQGPGPYLPLLLAITLSLLLWLQRTEAAGPTPRGTVRPLSAESRLPGASVEQVELSHSAPACRVETAPAVESLETRRPIPPSPATLAAVRRLKARREATTSGIQLGGVASLVTRPIRTALERTPVLACVGACYLLGHLVSAAGVDAAHDVANALAPAVLRHSYSGWPVLGIWASGWIGTAAGLWILWRRRESS